MTRADQTVETYQALHRRIAEYLRVTQRAAAELLPVSVQPKAAGSNRLSPRARQRAGRVTLALLGAFVAGCWTGARLRAPLAS